MRILRGSLFVLACLSWQGCGLHGWGPTVAPAGQPSFKCGTAGVLVKVTSGTDSLPGDVTFTVLSTNKASSRPINPLTTAAGAATIINLTCGDAGLKCSLEGFDSVKICGGKGVWQLDTGQITTTSTPFASD